jgi:uncharacterized protein YjgD (DUF1641 family)
MAMPVSFREFTPRNSRDDLLRRLERAPEEHVEAVLSAYDLLQRLHEKGLLEVARGLLSAGDTVVGRAVDVASSKQAVTALRVVLMLSNLIAVIDADEIHAVLSPPEKVPPSLWVIGKEAISRDARRGIAAAVGLLKAFGAALNKSMTT